MAFSLTLSGFDRVGELLQPFHHRRKISKAINVSLKEIESGAIKTAKRYYTYKGSFNSLISHKASTPSTLHAEIQVKYKPVPLTSYVYSLHKVAYMTSTGKRRYATAVKIKVKRSTPAKLVKGKLGYGGFFQRRPKSIFERLQQPTWRDGRRLPYRPLYGASVSELFRSKEVRGFFDKQGIQAVLHEWSRN